MKRILSFLLLIIILFPVSATAFAQEDTEISTYQDSYTKELNVTSDEAINWVRSKLGQAIDYDGAYGVQCVDLILAYYDYLGVTPSRGDARQYVDNELPEGWIRTCGGVPQKGDILVYDSLPCGHVAIYESDCSLYHQNYAHKYVEQSTFRYDNNTYMGSHYWGCIHPNFKNTPDPQPIPTKNGWYPNADGAWMYYIDDIPQVGWIFDGGVWYYLNDCGIMQTGWQFLDGKWYYLNGSGAMQIGWQFVDGKWYYLDESGAMQTGWQFLNGEWYYFNVSGEMQTGWQFINNEWYMFADDGSMYSNCITPDGYWVDETGKNTVPTSFLAGLPNCFTFSDNLDSWKTELTINSDGTFFGTYGNIKPIFSEESPNGELSQCNFKGEFTNFRKIDDYTCAIELSVINTEKEVGVTTIKDGYKIVSSLPYGFTDASGNMGQEKFYMYMPMKSTVNLDNNFLYWMRDYIDGETISCYSLENISNCNGFFTSQNDRNILADGWYKSYCDWKYYQGGNAKIGWINLGNDWYYLNSFGIMQTGWQFIGNVWYCFAEDGNMYKNCVTPDGYIVDGNGAWIG